MDAMLKNWMTGLMGAMTIICAASELAGLIPPPYNLIAPALCSVLSGFGLIAARDHNK